jgi:uncharacterized protein YutD
MLSKLPFGCRFHECVDVPVLVRRWKAILSFDFFIGDWALSAAYG